MTDLDRLNSYLKHKGIGPNGSKDLKLEELTHLERLLNTEAFSLTTRSCLYTAMIMLETTEAEDEWFGSVKELPLALIQLPDHGQTGLAGLVSKVIRKENLSEQECLEACNALFSSNEPDYLKATLLVALRLKRETFIENIHFLKGFRSKAKNSFCNTPLLLNIADSYDGTLRNPSYTLFSVCVLASLGYPTLIHGSSRIAPKEGISMTDLINATGGNPMKDLSSAQKQLENPDIRWCYIDQETFFPALADLKQTRRELIKRPLTATLEKLTCPIWSSGDNYIITSYTHSHYKSENLKLIQEELQPKAALNLKGIEGTTQPPLNKPIQYNLLNAQHITEGEFMPVINTYTTEDFELTAPNIIRNGLEALSGINNHAHEQIRIQCLTILHLLLGIDLETANQQITQTINSKKALNTFNKGI